MHRDTDVLKQSSSGSVRPYRSFLGLAYRIGDAVIVAGVLALVSVFSAYPWYATAWGGLYGVAAASAIAVFFLVAEHHDLYNAWQSADLRRETGVVLLAWLWAVLGLLLLAFATKYSGRYPRSVMLPWFCLVPVGLMLWRLLLRSLLTWRATRQTAVIYGDNRLARALREKLEEAPWMGLSFAGFYDDRGPPRCPESHGGMEQLVTAASTGNVGVVFIALPMRGEKRVSELLVKLADTPAAVYFVPDLFAFDLLHSHMLSVDGIPAFSVFDNPHYGLQGWLKRIEDAVLASLMLLLASLPMAFIALGIRLTMSGPVLFRQRRYGLDGKEIVVWKFRTMTVCEDGPQLRQVTRRDPRVTRLGRFLRRTSLDELPQLVNVLQGRMSLVGPRPHPIALNEEHRRLIYGYMLRHRVKPGITGLAQINGWRGETDTLEKMQARVAFDLEYIRNWSVWLDIKILLMTAVKGFRGENAY